jgi:hypothetical protein
MEDSSQPGPAEDRLTLLILAHLDERITDGEFEELQESLHANDEARARYVRLARLDSGLRDTDTDAMAAPVSIPFPSNPNPHVLPWKPLALAAALAILAVPASILLRSGDSDDDGGFAVAKTDQDVTRGIAVITAEAGAVWEPANGNTPRQGTPLVPGRLSLREGLAQIDFFGGASISISGPAELELVSPDAAVLHRGRLKADVPPAARGFEVKAGDVLLEDLGTSFGLAVGDNSDSADLVVFDGEVRAIGSDGKPLSLLGGDAAHLEKGEAVRQAPQAAGLFPDIADVIEGAGNRDEERYAAWKTSSTERRNDPRLIAYYDFENLTTATRRLENRATQGFGSELDGGIVGARVSEGRWGPKPALDFRLEGDRVRFDIPGEYEALTLYAWVRIDALDRGLNSLFLTDYFDPGEIHWQISREGAIHFATSPMGVVDIPEHNRRFYSDPVWEPGLSGHWLLLATTVDRRTGEVVHYRNGEALGFSGGTHMEKELPLMRIGEADLGNWSKPIWPSAIRTLNGRIDEFALYAAALSPAEIKTIYEQGKP